MLSKSIQISLYGSILGNLMSSVHSHHYEKDAHFEDDVLLPLNPYDIYGWISDKFYGTPTPTADNNPKRDVIITCLLQEVNITHWVQYIWYAYSTEENLGFFLTDI